jgi:hypothetical protein
MSTLIAIKKVDLLAPYLALDQGSRVQAECECYMTRPPLLAYAFLSHHPFNHTHFRKTLRVQLEVDADEHPRHLD